MASESTSRERKLSDSVAKPSMTKPSRTGQKQKSNFESHEKVFSAIAK